MSLFFFLMTFSIFIADFDYFGLILMVYGHDFGEIKESEMTAVWTA